MLDNLPFRWTTPTCNCIKLPTRFARWGNFFCSFCFSFCFFIFKNESALRLVHFAKACFKYIFASKRDTGKLSFGAAGSLMRTRALVQLLISFLLGAARRKKKKKRKNVGFAATHETWFFWRTGAHWAGLGRIQAMFYRKSQLLK